MNYFTACQRIPDIANAVCHPTAPVRCQSGTEYYLLGECEGYRVTPNHQRFMDNPMCHKIYGISMTDYLKIKRS